MYISTSCWHDDGSRTTAVEDRRGPRCCANREGLFRGPACSLVLQAQSGGRSFAALDQPASTVRTEWSLMSPRGAPSTVDCDALSRSIVSSDLLLAQRWAGGAAAGGWRACRSRPKYRVVPAAGSNQWCCSLLIIISTFLPAYYSSTGTIVLPLDVPPSPRSLGALTRSHTHTMLPLSDLVTHAHTHPPSHRCGNHEAVAALSASACLGAYCYAFSSQQQPKAGRAAVGNQPCLLKVLRAGAGSVCDL